MLKTLLAGGLLASALVAAPAAAEPLLGLDIGAPVSTATRTLAGPDLESWPATAPQALRRGLVQTGLLEALNRARAAELRRDGSLEPGSFSRFLRVKRAGVDYAMAFSKAGELRYLLARMPVPVATSDPFLKARLRPREAALASLRGLRLTPAEKDAHGNRRAWRGRSRRGDVWVRHVPEQDELWVLLHPRAGRRR